MMYWNGMGVWGWLMMIVFWVVIILLITWAVRGAAVPRQQNEDSPLRILEVRLARGEIDREEYEERRRVLTSGR